MDLHKFDERNIVWRRLEGIDDVDFYVYNVDEANYIVDVIFKFAPNSRAMLHQHRTPYITFVVQGELRFYRPNGELKEIRPTGSYVCGVANGEPHLEGAGEQEAIVFFSNRNVEEPVYEFLDENRQTAFIIGLADFKAQLEAQGKPQWQAAA